MSGTIPLISNLFASFRPAMATELVSFFIDFVVAGASLYTITVLQTDPPIVGCTARAKAYRASHAPTFVGA